MKNQQRGRCGHYLFKGLSLGCVIAATGASACGDSRGGPDAAAPPADAQVDSPIDAAEAPNVTVTLLYPPTEYSAALSAVVFYRANGTVSSIGRVDAEGKVRGFVTPDGAITMIKHVPGMGANAPAQSEIRTILAVQPGDDIRIGYRFNHQPFSPVTVNGPTYPGAASYTVTSYCNRGTSGSPVSTVPTGLVTQVAGCSNADFLLNARNAAGERIATLFQGGVAVSPNATVALAGNYAVPKTRTYTLQNVPAGITRVAVTAFPHHMNASYTAGLVPVNGTLNHTAVYADTSLLEPTTSLELSFDNQARLRYRQADDFVGPFVFDVLTNVLPRITATEWAGNQDTITWQQASGGVTATTVFTGFNFNVTARALRGDWRVMAEHGTARSIKVPPLPAEVAALGPLANEARSLPWVSLEAVTGTTYAQFRNGGWASVGGVYTASSQTLGSEFYPAE